MAGIFPPSTAMYKLVITINKQVQEPKGFETWQSAYKSLGNHLWRYENIYDELEVVLTIYNPSGKIIKNVGLLTSYGKSIFFKIQEPKLPTRAPLAPIRHQPQTITAHILSTDMDEDDLPF